MSSPLSLCIFVLVLMDFRVPSSMAGLQLSSSSDRNGSYCPGPVMLTCVGIEVAFGLGWAINGSIIHNYLPMADQTDFPIVVFRNDTITIKINHAVATSTTAQNITSELIGNVPNLASSNITCRTFTQESNTLVIQPREPTVPNSSGINVEPVYELMSSSLSMVIIMWRVPVELCVGVNYSYEVRLLNGSIILDIKNETCILNEDCQVTFMIVLRPSVSSYLVQIAALDGQGAVVDDTSIMEPINQTLSVPPDISVDFLPCSVKCISNLNGTCEIEYTQNSTTNFEGSVNGTVKSDDIEAPLLQPGFLYYRAIFYVDRNVFMLQGNTTIEYDDKWSDGVLAGAILGAILMILSFVLIIMMVVGLIRQWKHIRDGKTIKVMCIAGIFLSSVLVLVGVCVWIAGMVEVSKSGNCDSLEQPLQVLIAPCVLFGINILLDCIIIVVLHLFVHKSRNKLGQEKPAKKSEAEELLELHGVTEDQVKKNNNIGITDAEKTVVSGHRRIGETMQHGLLRVKEEIHQAVLEEYKDGENKSEDKRNDVRKNVEEMKSKDKRKDVLKSETQLQDCSGNEEHKNGTEMNIYSKTEHKGQTKKPDKKPKQGSNYSFLGSKPESSGERHYSPLMHNSADPAGASSATASSIATTATGVNMSHSTPPGYGQLGSQQSSSRPKFAKVTSKESEAAPEYGKLEGQEGTERPVKDTSKKEGGKKDSHKKANSSKRT